MFRGTGFHSSPDLQLALLFFSHWFSSASSLVFSLTHVCILWYFLSKSLTSLSCFLNAVFPRLKMWDTFACATLNMLTHFLISIAVLENVSPYTDLQKRATFSPLKIGLSGTGNRACVTSRGTNHSAIKFTFLLTILSFQFCCVTELNATWCP
jgi:hypothetical protein